ncbi:multicopper oxidase family protein [Halomonas sp. C05BenzN]|uniref:multicopper oxidase family protein n=1 Tax=Halomonas sp. C05BenzN TaxID=3411041 RepID=UPI003B9463F1
MQRRDFLRYSALGGVALSASGVLAYAMAGRHAGHAPVSLLDATTLPEGEPLQPLPRIANLSDQSDLFRSALTPAPHAVALGADRHARLWLYNRKVAPLIEVTEGDDFDVTLVNELPEETTVHWHGVAVAHEHDGAPRHAVAPGESRRYRHTFADGSAGLHWFHPHPHGVLARQIAHGLAGVLLVRPREEVVPFEVEEHLLVINDLRLSGAGEVTPHTDEDWMNGREGELLLVNGQRRPRLDVAPGTTLRLRLVNACAGRYLRLRLEDHGLTLIGTDGGLLEQPRPLEELLLTPGERADLLVRISEQGAERFTLASHPYERGWMGARPAHLDAVAPLLTIHTRETEVAPAVALPARLGRIEPLGDPAVRRTLALTEVMAGMEHGPTQADASGAMDHGGHGGDAGGTMDHGGHGGDAGGAMDHGGHGGDAGGAMDHGGHGGAAMAADNGRPPVDFLINGRSFTMGEVMFEGRVGEVEEWEVFNDSHMDHPFHVHGTHFQVVASREIDGEWRGAPWLAWKDTVNLRPGQRMRLRLVFHEPGDWLFHCHIIEHEEMGMMAAIRML